jgi:hypothetical protein
MDREIYKNVRGFFGPDSGKRVVLGAYYKEAKEHLILAGKIQGSLRLNSFGPDISLVKELLTRFTRTMNINSSAISLILVEYTPYWK